MIVLDSSFLVGFHNERDMHHQTALALMEQFLKGSWGRGLLVEYVFLEVTTVLLARRDLTVATRVGSILLEAQELDFVPCSDFFPEIFHMFQQQRGTKLSLADSAIAYVAQQRAEGFVLTFDNEFRKVGGIHVPQYSSA